MATRGWSGLYWARKDEARSYEMRIVTKKWEGTPFLTAAERIPALSRRVEALFQGPV